MRFSKDTIEAMSILAHVSMAHQISKDVKGMAGFSDFYRKQLSSRDLSIIQRFEELSKQAYLDLADMLSKEATEEV